MPNDFYIFCGTILLGAAAVGAAVLAVDYALTKPKRARAAKPGAKKDSRTPAVRMIKTYPDGRREVV